MTATSDVYLNRFLRGEQNKQSAFDEQGNDKG